MARIPRLHRVVATYRNGDVSEWHYQDPDHAKSRAAKLQLGRIPALNAEEMAKHREAGTTAPLDVPVSVKLQASHPILWPHEAGDATTLDVPDSTLAAEGWETILDDLGVLASAALSLTWHRGERVVVELENGKHAPHEWSVEITEEDAA